MNSLLLDTNVLLLFLVGNERPDKIGAKRLKEFDANDLRRVNEYHRKHPVHVTLPNILTEVSNLLGSGHQEIVPNAGRLMAWYCSFVSEAYLPSSEVVKDTVFARLGLTDTAIHRLADKKTTVLTIDYELQGRLASIGVEAINILHFKTPKGR